MDAARAMSVYHWMFLAQPEPLPEMLIGRAPREYIDHTLASWTGDEVAGLFWRGGARELIAPPSPIPRASTRPAKTTAPGATLDRAADEADFAAGRKIVPPLLALWGEAGIPAAGTNPLDVWRRWANDARGQGVPGGHFLPEEAPEATAKALLDFFA